MQLFYYLFFVFIRTHKARKAYFALKQVVAHLYLQEYLCSLISIPPFYKLAPDDYCLYSNDTTRYSANVQRYFPLKTPSIRVTHVSGLTCNPLLQILRIRPHFEHFLIIVSFKYQIMGLTDIMGSCRSNFPKVR